MYTYLLCPLCSVSQTRRTSEPAVMRSPPRRSLSEKASWRKRTPMAMVMTTLSLSMGATLVQMSPLDLTCESEISFTATTQGR